MTHRLLSHFFFSLIAIILTIVTPSQAQNQITIIEPDTSVCSMANVILPVMTGDIVNLDSISLVIHFTPGTLSYLSYREVQSSLAGNGDIDITEINDTTVLFEWEANEGSSANVTSGKLFEFVFLGGTGNGSISFNEEASLFLDNAGTPIATTYSGAAITVFPVMSIIIEEIDPTCPNECDANIAAYVTGGSKPYSFTWNGEPSVFDSVMTGACGSEVLIEVIDAYGCKIDTIFDVTELTAAEVEMESDPDTVYVQNPVVRFSFVDDPSIVDWYWDFGDGSQITREKNPVHLYGSAANEGIENYTAVLYYTNEDGCSDSSSFLIPVAEARIFIPNVFTPNGDSKNEYFQISKVLDGDQKVPITDEYIRMELIVLDRWGRKVYDNSDYDNKWDGDNLPEGTYYYRLNTFGFFKDNSYKGGVAILR